VSRALWLLLVLLLPALPAGAQAPQTVRVPDGNTIVIDDTPWRLWGIAAPELYQNCDDGWQAGQEAVRLLRSLIDGRAFSCEPRGKDRLGRVQLQCRSDGIDVGQTMIRSGVAWAVPGVYAAYTDQERSARTERRGAHDHSCELPLSLQQAPRRR
jgi:endonuclease YncB( thermonuclease family)